MQQVGPIKFWSIKNLSTQSDLMFAIGIVAIMVVLLAPMPTIMMDMSLAVSMTFSILILMTSLFIQKPLEFSSFPTILLVSTMMRLSLNVASTRLILTDGHMGPSAAGHVIEAFGDFVMGGNFVIGIIVFAILIIINFIVITKGSGRIAEVSARFTLDAMPGKQMAIDADLSSGIINEATAIKKRKELERESTFFGAMDGAAKFVRGDAIAGILITFINVIGGIIIGVAQNNLSFAEASSTYTILTVGDGLVTQIPALIVSTAAGMLVSKAGIADPDDKDMFQQLSSYPNALGLNSFLMAGMAFLPGIPFIPFSLMAGASGFLAWRLWNRQESDRAEKEQQELMQKQKDMQKGIIPEKEKILEDIDIIRVELGYNLLPLLNNDDDGKLPEHIKNLRFQLKKDFGFHLSSVRLQDNMQLEQDEYVIRIREMEAGRGTLRLGKILVMDPKAQAIVLAGEPTTEPTFGLPAAWVDNALQEEAEIHNYTIVEPALVLITHLSELVKDNIPDLLSFSDVQRMLDELNESYKKLLNDIVPAQITVGGIQRILQNLVGERVSIRDLTTILEGIAEGCTFTRNITGITEHVRLRLMRQITFSNTDDNGNLNVLSLSPFWEEEIAGSLTGDGDNKQLAMAPSILQSFIYQVNESFDKAMMMGIMPVMVTSSVSRPYVRSILERVRPSTVVLSQNEVHPKAHIKNIGVIHMPEHRGAA